MSKYDDKWLDICALLRELQSNGEILITPANNSGNLKTLKFQVLVQKISGTTAKILFEVLKLSDRFEFYVNNNKLEISVFVNVFNI